MPRAVVLGCLIVCTIAFALGRDNRGEPVARPYADAMYYYAYLPTIWLDGDVDFTNQYRETHNWYQFGKTPLGKPSNVFGIGPAVLSTPVFLLAHGLQRLFGERADGFSTVEEVLTMWLSVLLSVLSVWFAYRIVARRFGHHGGAMLTALAVFAGGPVIYYAIRQPGYAHPFSTFFTAWLVDAWDATFDASATTPRNLKTWLTLGCVMGAAMLARPQLATWGVLLAVAAFDDLRRLRVARCDLMHELPRLAGRLALAMLVIVLWLVPQMLTWKALYGRYWLVPQGEGFLRWDAPAWTETLFSSRNGLFPWSPLYAIAAIGLLVAIRRWPRVALTMIFGVLAQAFVNGAAWDWWGGGAYGGRRFDSTYVAFVIGFAVVLLPAIAAVRRAWTEHKAWIAAMLGAAFMMVSLVLLVANLVLTGVSSTPVVPIYGGRSAADVWRAKVPSVFGRVTAFASQLSNAPARIAFAWRHQVSRDAYDRVVGVHLLAETFPGLNSGQFKMTDGVSMADLADDRRPGLHLRDHGDGVADTGHGRLLIGLNRIGGVKLTISVGRRGKLDRRPIVIDPIDPSVVTLTWNGVRVYVGPIANLPTPVVVDLPKVLRGGNELSIDGPRGFGVERIDLAATGAR